MKALILAGLIGLAACSSTGSSVPTSAPAVAANTLVLAIDAFNCYEAVKAATSAANTAQNTVNALTAITASPACAGLTATGVSLVTEALGSNAVVVPASN